MKQVYGTFNPELLPAARRHNFSGRGSNQMTTARAILSAVDKALADPKLAAELGDFGREKAVGEFSLDQMAQRVEQVYYKALGRSSYAADR